MTADSSATGKGIGKRLRHRVETVAVASLIRLVRVLPRPIVLGLGWILGSLASWLDRRGRSTALENLRLAWPDRSERDTRRLVRRCYVNFARGFLDLFWFQRLGPDSFQRWVQVAPWDADLERELRSEGAIHLTPHFGNFEWASLIWGFRGFQMHVVAQDFKNPGLTTRFSRLREHSGHRMIPQRGAMLRLMKVLKRGGNVALLTDLNVKPGRSATVIRCFGRPTCVTSLHVDLARRCQRKMAAGVCEPIDRGRYRVRVLKVFDPLERDADDEAVRNQVQQVWDVFEEQIRRRPELWMWMYKHWRYRPTDDASGYPSYSNRSKAFAKMLNAQRNEAAADPLPG